MGHDFNFLLPFQLASKVVLLTYHIVRLDENLLFAFYAISNFLIFFFLDLLSFLSILQVIFGCIASGSCQAYIVYTIGKKIKDFNNNKHV